MIKTDPTMLVYDATEQPWTLGFGGNPEDDYGVIVSPHRERAICNYKTDDIILPENAQAFQFPDTEKFGWMPELIGGEWFKEDEE